MRIAKKTLFIISFIFFYIKELILANLILAKDILSANPKFDPKFVVIPLHLKRGLSKTLLFNLVTMTPGSLSIDIDSENNLYIHALYVEDMEQFIKKIYVDLENKIIHITEI